MVPDTLSCLFRSAILVLGLLTVLVTGWAARVEHFAEYLALLLFSVTGMLLLTGAGELLMIFIALELTSLPLYLLAAFQKNERASAEAGLKYFLLGGVSAAFLLFGMSLIYGVTGTTSLRTIASLPGLATDPLMLAGIVLMVIGFGFKAAAVPFHFWAPDVYQGAPTPAAALIASGSKVAGIFLLGKLLLQTFAAGAGTAGAQGFTAGWVPVLAALAVASILLGNLGALVQSNVKRLLAYSAIAHGGYLLLGYAAGGRAGCVPVFFHLLVYALTALGAFAVVSLVERSRGGSGYRDFAGLHQTSPVLAVSFAIFLVSLAGIPPLAGFTGKFLIFAAALAAPAGSSGGSLLWLVIIAIAANAISLYYYLIVLKHVFVQPPAEAAAGKNPALPPGAVLLIALLAAVILLLGLFPGLLLQPLEAALATSFPSVR